ncbi:MAG TPA: hypothetical protein VKH64_15515 [Candidatus Binatia bacterium]|nr:hypothetical protein [Candidatus Binatia bacterium]
MAYKTILFGILLLFSVPAAASAQTQTPPPFGTSFSGTQFGGPFGSGFGKVKGTVFTSFSNASMDVTTTMVIARDAQFKDVVATLQIQDYFDTSTSTGAFSFVQDDPGAFGVFIGTFKSNADVVTSFTGTLTEIFSDGSFEIINLKSGKQIVQ